MSWLCTNPKKVIPQTLAALSASLGFFITGLVRGWSSPGIPSLVAAKTFNITVDDISWIASLPPLGALGGALAASIPLKYTGSRKTLIALVPIFVTGWLLIGFAKHKGMVMAGRYFTGFMNGMSIPAGQIYISECSSPRIRGALGSSTALLMALGILIAYIFGSFLEWDQLAWFISAFPFLLGVCMFFCPESPAFLLSKDKEEEAMVSLQKLRGSHTNITEEFQRIQENIKYNQIQEKFQLRHLRKGWILKPLIISLALMFFQQFSGVNAVLYYTVSIFASAGSTINKHLSTIIIGIVQLLSTAVSVFVVDKVGRKVLLLVSSALMTLSLSAMGAYFYVKETQGDAIAESKIGWLPLLSLIVFMVFYSIGFNTVPFLIMGEIFPSRFRNFLGSLSSSFNLLCTFVVVKTFPDLKRDLGQCGAFWFYGSCCVAAFFFVLFAIPETKGKTLEDIEKFFRKPKDRLTQVVPVKVATIEVPGCA